MTVMYEVLVREKKEIEGVKENMWKYILLLGDFLIRYLAIDSVTSFLLSL